MNLHLWKSYARDNRLLWEVRTPCEVLRCRLIQPAVIDWQRLDCSSIKGIRELGSDRRKTDRLLSVGWMYWEDMVIGTKGR